MSDESADTRMDGIEVERIDGTGVGVGGAVAPTRVVIRKKRWKRPVPTVYLRVCPDCGALVNGQGGQAVHALWHVNGEDD